MIEITRQDLRRAYDVVHVHSVPDFEVFAAIGPKLRGAKIILDIHDIVPEFYAAKFHVGYESFAFKALLLAERLSASFANHVIVANDIWLERISGRSAPALKCSAFINYPDLSVFNPSLRNRGDSDKFIVVYPGTLNWHQGVDVAVRAFAQASVVAPDMEFHIYGEGPLLSDIQNLVESLRLHDRVRLMPPMPQRQIARIMANADLGVVPKRNDAFGGDAFSTKSLEFMALGVPLVMADTRIDRYYFDDSVVRFFEAGDAEDLARALVEAYVDRDSSAKRARKAYAHALQMSWQLKKLEYMEIVETLSQ
jgi:glycosyltransferase involved in cell wall biosynthesis